MKILVIFITLLVLNSNLFSQTLTREQVQADIDTVLNILSNIHPTFNQTTNKQELIKVRNTVNNEMSVHDFFRMIQPLITIDGHTTLQFNAKIYPEIANPLFPFETVVVNDKLYIKNNLSADTLIGRGVEILTINNEKTSSIIREILHYVPGEKKEYKIRKLDNGGFTNWYRLVYGNCETFSLTWQKDDTKTFSFVKGINRQSLNQNKNQDLDFRILEPDIGYLKVGKFVHPKYFMPFLDSVFTEMRNQEINHLIIDKTRGGGFSILADSLLSFISENPYREFEKKEIRISPETQEYITEIKDVGNTDGEYFVVKKELHEPVTRANRFLGKVYVLTGPTAYSAATLFVAMAKCYSSATIVGQETGQPLISNGDISRHKLPNTGLNLYTSHTTYYLPCAINDQDGAMPNIKVDVTLNDLLIDNDKYLKFTLNLIRENSR